MARLTDNEFSSYALDDEEQLQGSLLTITQKQVIQNQLAAVASEKLALEFNTDNPDSFTQQEAYKRGQLDTLNYILVASDAAEDEILNRNLNPT